MVQLSGLCLLCVSVVNRMSTFHLGLHYPFVGLYRSESLGFFSQWDYIGLERGFVVSCIVAVNIVAVNILFYFCLHIIT